MLPKVFSSSLLALSLLAGGVAAQEVYVVHGINGTDIGLDEALPVDIAVDGACALEDVPFGTATGPIALTTGDTRITVRLSDGVPMSCTGTVVLDQDINLAAFETAVVVAKLDENNTISLGVYSVDTRPIDAGNARLTVAHAAVAPSVDVALVSRSARAELREFRNGEQSFPLDAPADNYVVRVRTSFPKKQVLAKLDGVAVEGNLVVVAVGSVANGTFSVIPVAIGS